MQKLLQKNTFILTILFLFSCSRSVEKSQVTIVLPGALNTSSSPEFISSKISVTSYENTQYVYLNNATIQGIPVLYRDVIALHLNVDGTQAASTASPAFCSGTNCIFRGL